MEQLLKSNTPAHIAQRALALLLLEEAESVAEVAELLRVCRQTVYNWATRFERRRALCTRERLADGPRSGRPATALGIIGSPRVRRPFAQMVQS